MSPISCPPQHPATKSTSPNQTILSSPTSSVFLFAFTHFFRIHAFDRCCLKAASQESKSSRCVDSCRPRFVVPKVLVSWSTVLATAINLPPPPKKRARLEPTTERPFSTSIPNVVFTRGIAFPLPLVLNHSPLDEVYAIFVPLISIIQELGQHWTTSSSPGRRRRRRHHRRHGFDPSRG